jgi:NADH-quinone oxidoreductase subunit G/NADP-reducing hydrogenase subunit HndD
VTTCHTLQGVGAIDFVGRGYETRVAPGFSTGLNGSDCVFCGQCARVCPTGAIVERSHVDSVMRELADPSTVVVVQVAPAVPATLLDETGDRRAEGGVVAELERLAAVLKGLGFDAVFDTGFAADLTILEEASELVARLSSDGPLPLFTSCSPAWVHYVETRHPELIPHLSTCKSPQQMAGTLIKRLYPRHVELDGRRLVVVSVMPCTAKKFEADDQHEVDYVLTTRELGELCRRFGVDLAGFEGRAPLDPPFSEATGAGRLFGGTGGVMEAAVRTAHKLVTGSELAQGPKVADARGLEGVRCFTVEIGGTPLTMAIVNGLGRVGALLDGLRDGSLDVQFVEVMSCPGGCVGGGGQPYATDLDSVRRRLTRLHDADRRASRRRSHDNVQVQALYEELLGAPLGPASHELLHRSYVDRSGRATADAVATV